MEKGSKVSARLRKFIIRIFFLINYPSSEIFLKIISIGDGKLWREDMEYTPFFMDYIPYFNRPAVQVNIITFYVRTKSFSLRISGIEELNENFLYLNLAFILK